MALSLPGERSLAAASPTTPLRAFFAWVARINADRARRTALQRLLELDPERLRDLGLSRQDIHQAMAARSGPSAAHVLTTARAQKALA